MTYYTLLDIINDGQGIVLFSSAIFERIALY
jgi:hypothetical protein